MSDRGGSTAGEQRGPPTPTVVVGGTVHEGTAIDLRGRDPGAVARAVETEGGAGRQSDSLVVESADPAPVWKRLVPITAETSIAVRATLASAARSRGLSAPQDEAIDRLQAKLDDVPEPEREDARHREPPDADRVAELRERAATIRGRIEALTDLGRDASDQRDELQAVIAELSEARTEQIAAEQDRQRRRQAARELRDRRERRLRLRDRIDNRRREARAHLAERVWPEFVESVRTVPSGSESIQVGDGPGTYEGDDATAALAIARVATIAAPLVVACGRFEDAHAARDCLGCPVLRIE